MLFEIDNLKKSDTVIKYCVKCNLNTNHFVYRCWVKARGKYKFAKQCIKCKRERDKLHVEKNENRKNQIKNARVKFKESGKLAERYNAYAQKSRLKEKEKANHKLIQKHESIINAGSLSVIYPINCKQCGKKEIRRKPYRDGNICGYCYISNIHSQPAKLERYCIDCNSLFIGNHFNKRCKSCRAINLKHIRKIHSSKRKALERSATIPEPVNPIKVFERDKWRCQICNKKVQIKTAWKCNSAELDHIVPLSKGGVHTYSNVQCLCRQCNGTQGKGARLIGQLTLQM